MTSAPQSPKASVGRRTAVAAAILFGGMLSLALGTGGYTFIYAKGWSYLGNNPQTCANCHLMEDHLGGWMKGSHHAFATCNDCHTPHNFIGKYMTKADHGFWHSYAFTTGDFHEPIQMSARSRKVTEDACRYCHQDITHDIRAGEKPGDELSCIRCHHDVGHLR